ncbi:MAG: PIN domain-containing protein [Prevotella sp.]|nr:PIN domain-containing protein [Prevotella sp.]
MRYILDTNIMLFLLNETTDLSNDVETILMDYGNYLYMCAASVRELVAAWHKYTHMQKRWKTPEVMISFLQNQYGIEILYPFREHYITFIKLDWNLSENHRDTTDILIIAHAITERLTLISSDRKFSFYTKQGLSFMYNSR